MKKRFLYIGLFFVIVLLLFILQKPFFMLYNGSIDRGADWADYFRVMWHGASLDAAVAGYLTALPWLVILVSVWFRKFPLRKILVGYYALIALTASLIFVGDMALYPFWNFKLDASVFFYLDSPKNAMASVSVGFVILRLCCILLLSGLGTWILFGYLDTFSDYSQGASSCHKETVGQLGINPHGRTYFYRYPWWSDRIDFKHRSGIFLQRRVSEPFCRQSSLQPAGISQQDERLCGTVRLLSKGRMRLTLQRALSGKREKHCGTAQHQTSQCADYSDGRFWRVDGRIAGRSERGQPEY